MEAAQSQSESAGVDAVLDRKLKNTLPLYGNRESMNLNSMILTNIQGSPYFKEDLYQYKTFHEVVDEIFYKVEHLEPWEKNSRKLAGQVGMCGGVRGVAAGGIVSTAFCLLYKLFTLKLTRRQLTSLINHRDSPYIRGLGFLYIRYCQPPADFWAWMGDYIDDEEEIDLKAGGGYQVTIGEMVRMTLTKLEWFGTLFPRFPLNIQRQLEEKIKEVQLAARQDEYELEPEAEEPMSEGRDNSNPPGDEWGEAGRRAMEELATSSTKRSKSRERRQSRSHSPRRRSRERRRDTSRDRGRERDRSRDKTGRSRGRSHERRRNRSRDRSCERKGRRSRDRSRERRRSRSRDRSRERRSRSRDRSRERKRSPSRDRSRERRRSRSRDRSRERKRTDRSREQKNRSRGRERRQSRSRERNGTGRSRSRSRRSDSRDRERKRERVRSNERRQERGRSPSVENNGR